MKNAIFFLKKKPKFFWFHTHKPRHFWGLSLLVQKKNRRHYRRFFSLICFRNVCFPKENQQPICRSHSFFQRKRDIFYWTSNKKTHILPTKIDEHVFAEVSLSDNNQRHCISSHRRVIVSVPATPKGPHCVRRTL